MVITEEENQIKRKKKIMNNNCLTCKICGENIQLHLLNTHIKYYHSLEPIDYYRDFYNIKFKSKKNKFVGNDIYFILQMRELYPQFSNDLELFQYLYENHECNYSVLSQKFNYNNIYKLCDSLGVKVNYNLTKEHKEKISQKHKGKKLSTEHKKKISEGYHNLPEEKKEEISKKISKGNKGKTYSRESIEKMINNRKDEKHPFRGKAGKRADLDNQYFRSTWEANYARILRYLNVEYQFEPDIIWLKRQDGSEISYRPDFKVGDLYIEIKGYWYEDAVEKMKMLKEQYPEIKVKVITSKIYNKLVKFYKKKIESWE
jgi:transcription elongation factor Elf1